MDEGPLGNPARCGAYHRKTCHGFLPGARGERSSAREQGNKRPATRARGAVRFIWKHHSILMNTLSSLFSALSRKHGPAKAASDNKERMAYLVAGGAGVLQAIRARGFHKLVGLALAGGMLYKGLKGHGHGHGHMPALAHARTPHHWPLGLSRR